MNQRGYLRHTALARAQEADVQIFLLRAAANQNKPSLKGNDDNVEL